MKVTLLDEQGVELTEITSHLGRSAGHMLVDWATRPDALFQHYFDRGSRTVTAVIDAATWSAVLSTRWQMGARCWFLHELLPVPPPAQAAGQPQSKLDSGFGASDTLRSNAVRAAADLDAPAASANYAQRGVLR